jgi:hypothetical protein
MFNKQPASSGTNTDSERFVKAGLEEDRKLASALAQANDMTIDEMLGEKPSYTPFSVVNRSPSPQAPQMSEQQLLEEAIRKKRLFQGNLTLVRTGKEKEVVRVADVAIEAHCYKAAGGCVQAATYHFIALIFGNRASAYDIYKLLKSGSGGIGGEIARHDTLAAVFLCVAFEASVLTPREVKEEKVTEEMLDGRVKDIPRSDMIARCHGEAGAHKSKVFAAAKAVYRAMQEGEFAFITSGLPGVSLALASQHLEEVDAKVAEAVRSGGGPPFPIGLGDASPEDEWSIIDFFTIPELLGEWEESSECGICSQEFTLFLRRHHCRNCGMSCCGDHSRNRSKKMYGGRPADGGDKSRKGSRVCTRCWKMMGEGRIGEHRRADFPYEVMKCKAT